MLPVVAVTQRVEDLPDRGERRDALDQAWAPLLSRAGCIPVAVPNRLDDPATFLDRFDVALIVLTGGNDLGHLPGATNPAPERDALEGRLLDLAGARTTPVLGVCRGMQMMVDHYGGTLSRIDGHVARPHPIEVTAPGRWPLRDARVVNSFHDWGVAPERLGPDLLELAVAPDGTVEAACHRELPQVGVMWHPERATEDAVDLDLIRALVGRGR
jgi:N5-(cytidine 5'-diphosphoramidyl)-L-glutamine hydrolase